MTQEETDKYYKARQAYREKCEAFKEEVHNFFVNYKPRNYDLQNRHQ